MFSPNSTVLCTLCVFKATLFFATASGIVVTFWLTVSTLFRTWVVIASMVIAVASMVISVSTMSFVAAQAGLATAMFSPNSTVLCTL